MDVQIGIRCLLCHMRPKIPDCCCLMENTFNNCYAMFSPEYIPLKTMEICCPLCLIMTEQPIRTSYNYIELAFPRNCLKLFFIT